jgi:spore maturation protein SpmB
MIIYYVNKKQFCQLYRFVDGSSLGLPITTNLLPVLEQMLPRLQVTIGESDSDMVYCV